MVSTLPLLLPPLPATMAGTRLIVHTIFVIELLLLVGTSFLYASNKRHDPSASAEPFLPDQTGWKIVVEDVAPSSHLEEDAGAIVRLISYAGEFLSMVFSQVHSLLGISSPEAAKQHDSSRRRRPSAFVQEMRRLVSNINGAEGGTSANQNRISHPLKFILRIPQAKLFSEIEFIVGALEKGLRQGADLPPVVVQPSSRLDDVEIEACDDFLLRTTTQSWQQPNHRKVKYPEIFLLIGCDSATNPDLQKMSSSVDVIGNTDLIVVRSRRTFDQRNELLFELENEISNLILSTVFISLSAPEEEFRLGKVFVNLIDENPSSHHVAGRSSITTKDRFDIIGNALSSSVRSVIGPLLEDLSFIYGGEMEHTDVGGQGVIRGIVIIGLEAHSSAYLSLPNNIIESVAEDNEPQSTATKYVSTEKFASWIHTNSRQAVRKNRCRACRSDVVEWNLFVPSLEHIALMVRDEESGEVGESFIISHAGQFNGGITTHDMQPNGISIVNLPEISELFDPSAGHVNVSRHMYQIYQDRISISLVHLAGFLRASFGLPVFTTPKVVDGEGAQMLTFWEMEAIARSHYNSSLEYALQQTDAQFAVLHRHGRTLALPIDVAHKLNNATNLLRQSMSLIKQGYPTVYATSLIHGSLQYLESVQRDHRVHELPHFALDHYLAVFSPLVLPLLLPMLAGFIREVKRYRKLRNKKIEIL